MKRWGTIIIVILWIMGTTVYATDMTSAGFIIKSPELDTGGGYGSSGNFTMFGAGNTNVSGSAGSSANYQLKEGILYYPTITSGVLSGAISGSDVNLTWTASTANNGLVVSGYNVGISTTSGSGYSFTSVGNVTSYSYTSLTPATYYFVLQTLDGLGNVIATSNEVTETIQESVSFSISDNSVSFGTLTPAGPRYATTSGGSGSLAAAHTITASSNSSSGYTIYYQGATLSSGPNSISPATITGSSTGSAGTNQFALALLAAGSASVPTSYDESSANWSFAQNTLSTIATTSGPTAVATLNAYYLANAGTTAQAGSYSTVLTYEMTANY